MGILNFLKKKSGADSVTWLFKAPTDDFDFNWTSKKGLNFYETSLYLNRGLNKRADKVGEIQFVLKNRKSGEVVDPENEWMTLLGRPNDFQTGSQFWKLYQKYRDIFGEAYILKVTQDQEKVFKKKGEDQKAVAKKAPTKLILLEPYNVTKKLSDNQSTIVGFQYTGKLVEQKTYTPDEVIYLFSADPKSPLDGEPLIRSGLRSLEVETTANEYQAKAIKSGGKIDTLIKVKDATSSEQIELLRKKYRELKKEMWENGDPEEPMFAGGDMDILRLSLNPAELAYLESRKMSIDDISALTGVPKTLLALASGETFSNADASIKVFLRETIKPIMTELCDILDWRLIPMDMDLDIIDPTPEEKESVRQSIKLASDINAVSTNEKRRLLADLLGEELPDVDGGEEVLVPFSVSPLSGATAEPTQAPVQDPNNQDPNAQGKKKDFKHPLQDPERRKAYRNMYSKKLERAKSRVTVVVKDYFKDQEQRITGYLQKSLKAKSIIDDAFNMNLEVRLAKSAILDVIKSLFMEAGKEHLLFLGSDKEFNYTSTMDASLSKRAELFAQSINETQFKKLKNAFSNSIDNNETRDQLVGRIQNVYKTIDEGWAEVIARTEAHTAIQGGNLEAIKVAGMPIKIWVHGVGVNGGSRADHVAMDGEEVPRNSVFHLPSGNTCQAPSQTGDPADDVNCECSVV